MSEKNKDGANSKKIFKLFVDKIKSIKHLDIILTVLFVSIILLIYFSTFSSSNNDKKDTTNNLVVEQIANESEDLTLKYAKDIEDKLCMVISNLQNAGKVSVAVKLSGCIEKVYAYTVKTETLQDGTKIETKTPILTTEDNKSTPIVLQTTKPNIESIVVISTGAKDTNVKLDILRVVELLYNLPSSKIEIFVGN